MTSSPSAQERLVAALLQRLPPPPAFLGRAAIKLYTTLRRAVDSMVPAQVVLFEHTTGVIRTGLVAAAARLRVADLLAEGPLGAAEIAARTGADPDMVHRTLRALASLGVFELGDDGRFRNNRISEALREGPPSSALAGAEYWGTHSNMHSWADYYETVRTGKNAFERVHGMSVWEWFEKHPDEGRTFNAFMLSMTTVDAPFVASGYPWTEIVGEGGVVCDVAGGRGTLLAAILERHPTLRGTLVDAPRVHDEAKSFLASKGLEDRVTLAFGNIFEDVPGGASAYILKDILHDWDDARSLRILRNIRNAMQRGNRLLVIETLVERDDALLPGPVVDVHMGTVCSDGRQRSEADFRRLFDEAGFSLARVVPLATMYGVVEGVAV